jgi:hypothetical protein
MEAMLAIAQIRFGMPLTRYFRPQVIDLHHSLAVLVDCPRMPWPEFFF